MNNTSFMEKLLGLSDRQAGGGFSFPPSSVGMHTLLLSGSVCIPTQERGNELDPYRFDFLGLTDDVQEREIEGALVQHVMQFLLELGAGFAFVGRQVLLQVGEEAFSDSFPRSSVGMQTETELQVWVPTQEHGNQRKIVAEYALGDKTQPMGIAEYKLQEALPETLETNLPSIEQIERELQGDKG